MKKVHSFIKIYIEEEDVGIFSHHEQKMERDVMHLAQRPEYSCRDNRSYHKVAQRLEEALEQRLEERENVKG